MGGGLEGGRGSPKGRARVETLMESLQATFPSFSEETLRGYVSEYRAYQGANALKGLSVHHAVNALVGFIMSKNKVPSTLHPILSYMYSTPEIIGISCKPRQG